MIYKKEVTEAHTSINAIIHKVNQLKLIAFVNKLLLKFANYVKELTGNKARSSGIAEKHIAHFYSMVHAYSTSAEYRMNCLMLFEDEDFSDYHMIVCYNLVEAVRLFYLKQKVDLLKIGSGNIAKRCVTDASRARVRYVAGYCLASLRKKYTKMQASNLCSKSKQGQDTYTEAKWVVSILNLLKEDEQYLKTHTDEPDSLADVERKQYTSRGLTNVSDNLFKFFVSLTENILALLVCENLMKYGKNMYTRCLESIIHEQTLYEQFANVVVSSYSKQPVEEFDESSDVSSLLEKLVLISAQVSKIYHELVQKYLMVLLSQFRKDAKSAFRVEKTMAHRKQIKVTKPKQSKLSLDIPRPSIESEPGPSKEPLTSLMEEPQPGPSSHVSDTEDASDLCQSCFTDKQEAWIQCDSCSSWYHRKCAGLATAKLWNKFSKEGVSWVCKSCK